MEYNSNSSNLSYDSNSSNLNYYRNAQQYFTNQTQNVPQGMDYGTVNSFNAINIPYGGNLLPSNVLNRQGAPSAGSNFVGSQFIQPMSIKGPQNSQASKMLDNNFLNNQQMPAGIPQNIPYTDNFSNISLQESRTNDPYSISQNILTTNSPAYAKAKQNAVISSQNPKQIKNYYVGAASETLHQQPDSLMMLFFSDDNISHLRKTVVQKVKEITAESGVAGDNEGVTIQPPNVSDFFNFMITVFSNLKIHNGSICFVNNKNKSDLKSDISKLNTSILQDYISKMVSQINMYIYYYKDASQIPDQLSLPTYTSMKGSKSLEYNTGFMSGNSIGIASYNQVGNII